MRSALVAMTFSVGAFTACTHSSVAPSQGATLPAPVAITQAVHPEWTKSAVIYEVNIRQYTPQGTFAAFTTQLPRLKALGVDILWIMPVQPIGKLNRKGSTGSPYSISDYTAVNPEFGTEADFKAMVAAAHAQGLKVILDWVANHTAWDHAWATEHRDWHTRRPDGSLSRPRDNDGVETDWSDVADLNYNSQPMRNAMIGEMRWWVETMGIDGFRCDVAGFVPKDFWVEVRAGLQPVRQDLFWLAEWEDPELHRSFDATYGWDLFHLMNDVAQLKKPVTEIDAYFRKQDTQFNPDAYRMYFTSNHDENTWNGTEFERMGPNHLAAYILSATVRNSMPLLYSGQEASFNRRLPFFEKDSIDWNGPSLTEFYRGVFALRHTQDVLWNGAAGAPQTRLTTSTPDRVYAFSRDRGGKSVVVFTNFASAAATVSYSGVVQPGTYTNWFSKTTVTLGASGSIDIPGNGFLVLVR
jgi:alpha-amylase